MTTKAGWFTPYILNPHNIDRVVDPSVPGIYVLGMIGPDKKFKVKHIKSAKDVRVELRKYLGQYQVFMYKPYKRFFAAAGEGQQTLRLRFN